MFALSILLFNNFIYPFLTIYTGDDCDKCKYTANSFISGIHKSAGKNFGGGNSLWEEEHLGSYSVSEARYHDIIEGICSDVKHTVKCHEFLENIEHHLEDWWLKDFRNDTNKSEQLEEDLCVIRTKFCCPANFFGPLCNPCPLCYSLGGRCDGNGTRSGRGDCVCSDGYTGQLCDACDLKTHFQSQNESSLSCSRCHLSCSGGCSGPFPENCSACAYGWTSIHSGDHYGCVDIDECFDKPCNSSTQFCLNTPGSYKCISCHSSCNGCSGPTAVDCKSCAKGYQRGDGDVCEDINECNADSNICNGEAEICKNTIGSYTCDCKSGYSRYNNACVLNVKPDKSLETSGKSETQSKTHKINSHSRNKQKIIWTVTYTKEFLKYSASVIAFVVFCWFVKEYPLAIVIASVLISSFVYLQSVNFDFIFANQR
uniref:Cysteine-rich with EGF-like domain protein 1 n=1 Tax=Schistosoma japonicum TaxID=6182 RepID=C1LEC1_SCHJA|nr:Cysteine-rich with EGF-like domain protein 1 precursor [Schistosoma japonicum]